MRRPVIQNLDSVRLPLRTAARLANCGWNFESGRFEADAKVGACRAVPLPPELARDLEMVHYLREASPRRVREPLWNFLRATAHRKVVAVMRRARMEGPQACPKGLRHGFGIAAVTAGVPLPTIAAVLGHADIATTAIYTTAVSVEARAFLAKMWG